MINFRWGVSLHPRRLSVSLLSVERLSQSFPKRLGTIALHGSGWGQSLYSGGEYLPFLALGPPSAVEMTVSVNIVTERFWSFVQQNGTFPTPPKSPSHCPMLKLKRFLKLNSSPELPLECESLEPRVLLSTVELFAAGDVGNELMQLQVDEVPVQTWRLGAGAAQGNFQRFVYETPETLAPNRIRVAFLNDSYDPANGVDANLRLDAMVLDGIRYETESPTVFSTGTWRPEDGVAPGFRESEYLHANGYFIFAATGANGSQITIRAAGQTGQEQMRLLIDDNVVASWNNIGGNPNQQLFQTFNFTASELVTADRIRVEFTNDAFNPSIGLDRNLFVQGITVDGIEYRTDSPTVLSTGTARHTIALTRARCVFRISIISPARSCGSIL